MLNWVIRCDCGSEDVCSMVRETEGTIVHYFKCNQCGHWEDPLKLELVNGKAVQNG